MKYFYLLFCIFIVGSISAQRAEQKINDTIITWKSNYLLTWNDFQGDPGKNVYARAQTSYKIEIVPRNVLVDSEDNIQGVEKLTVEAQFYKKKSFKALSNYTASLLRHEQLHFDIAELYARKIRARFTELKAAKEAKFSLYWENYSVLWKECRALQKEYDTTTNHGRELYINKKWDATIKQELELLAKFE
jgi:hypothetical protein